MSPPDALHIRTIEPDELDALRALYRDLNPDDLPLDTEQSEAIFRRLLDSREIDVWVAELERELVATCISITVPNLTRGGRPYVVIENVVTKLERRGQGIGKELLQHVIERSHARGSYKVMLQSGSTEASTIGFYKGLGFRDDDKRAYVIKADVPKVRY